MIWGIGTDIVELARIERFGCERLAKRILTAEEWAKMPEHPRRSLEYVAGRFAAKEAISKALGTGIGGACSFQDIEVMNDGQGKPFVSLAGMVSEWVLHGQPVAVHLSISHSEHYAQAMAVIEKVDEA
ncbi:holo-ACP synthase [Laceyella putida]|uniref:Holo-[acyl-carrier-protein] synthase n=1 Tax=Laceyella putida TaxID=110101 RepID=A0ABW2RLC4_9BACL